MLQGFCRNVSQKISILLLLNISSSGKIFSRDLSPSMFQSATSMRLSSSLLCLVAKAKGSEDYSFRPQFLFVNFVFHGFIDSQFEAFISSSGVQFHAFPDFRDAVLFQVFYKLGYTLRGAEGVDKVDIKFCLKWAYDMSSQQRI